MVPSSDIQGIVRQADEAKISKDALQLYQKALEQLHTQISTSKPGAEQDKLIEQFKAVLVKAEALKQHNSEKSSYEQYKAKAKVLAGQAVAADGRGELADALQQYCQLLEVLNHCHQLEEAPGVKAAIMARFQVYLERAEQIRNAQQHLAPGAATAPQPGH